MRSALVPSMLAVLLGCQSIPPATPRPAALVLNHGVTVPAGRAAVDIQAGELRQGDSVDRYRPYCRLELARLADTARDIRAGRYTILRQYQAMPAARTPGALRHVSLTAASGDPSYYVFATVFDIAPNEAGVSRLSCQHWEVPTPNPPRHLTPAEIDSALGAIARLE